MNIDILAYLWLFGVIYLFPISFIPNFKCVCFFGFHKFIYIGENMA